MLARFRWAMCHVPTYEPFYLLTPSLAPADRLTPPHLALSLPHLSPSPPPPVARLLTSRTLFPTSLLPLRPCAPVPLRPCATVPVAYRLSPACSYESYPLALKDSGAVAANGVTQFTGGAQVHPIYAPI